MRVCDLDGRNEAWFLNSIEGRWPEYFWFLVDWMFERDRTSIRFAEEDGTLLGASLVYDHKIVQLRGEPGACTVLAKLLEEQKVEINAPLHMKDELLRMFHPEVHFNIVLMTVGRGRAQTDEHGYIRDLDPRGCTGYRSALEGGRSEMVGGHERR